MKLTPKKDQIVARTVDFVKSSAGLVFPEIKGGTKATIFALIESVGPDVKSYKPGQVVLCQRHNQIFLRDGFHRLIFPEEEILSAVDDLDLSLCSISGMPPGAPLVDKGNGRGEVHADGA